MAEVTYEIVEHDGGWAYKVDGVFSEPFPTHADALAAAVTRARQETWKLAAQEHQRHCISFDCRDNKRPCNECETYRQRGEC